MSPAQCSQYSPDIALQCRIVALNINHFISNGRTLKNTRADDICHQNNGGARRFKYCRMRDIVCAGSGTVSYHEETSPSRYTMVPGSRRTIRDVYGSEVPSTIAAATYNEFSAFTHLFASKSHTDYLFSSKSHSISFQVSLTQYLFSSKSHTVSLFK